MDSLLRLQDVTHFYGTHCALRDVELNAPPGAIGLVGENGAGKSTLMQILLGTVEPTHGTATVLGESVASAGIRLRGKIGFMPERDCMIPGLKGIEYATLAGELNGMPRRQAMRRGHETLSYLGLEEARYRRVEQYSVGMMQRLKLAAALVHDPDLLLLDEPTAGLDPEGRARMIDLLGALASRSGKSLLLSTHLLSDIERVCGSAIILHQGQVVSYGALDELRAVRRRSYLLTWEGDGEAFLNDLERRGVELKREGRKQARAIVENDFQTRVFFQASSEQDMILTEIEPEEDDLEAVYLRLVGASEPAATEGNAS